MLDKQPKHAMGMIERAHTSKNFLLWYEMLLSAW